MTRRLNTEKFIVKARKVHGDKYNYDKSVYVTSTIELSIYCSLHGDILQKPYHHLAGHGCKHCALVERGEKKKKVAKLTFEEKSNKLHNNYYDYSKVLYIDSQTKVEIVCPVHSSFSQTPSCHLAGHGCWKCYLDSKYRTSENFIEEANKVHNNFYSYEKFVYNYAREKSTITCPLHGDFLQTPDSHSQGRGCTSCGTVKLSKINSENPTGWRASDWQKKAETSKTFDGYKVYILKLSATDEIFYKIGRTYRAAMSRVKDIYPYECKIIHTISHEDSRTIFDLETQLKREYKKFRYTPLIPFGGMRECFSLDLPISTIIANYPTNYILQIDDALTPTP